jgi:3-hydroxyisobutyrate dehydrogenase-like beta-hydroxyacid dehydrogenase
VAEALAANELVVLSLTDYQAMYDILADVGGALAGRVVVNLSSDTPDGTRAAADRLAARGARLLAGGVLASADMVGAEGAAVLYSGPREAFDAHEATLAVLGTPEYLGADHALAQLHYQAQLQVFLTTLAAYLQSFAMFTAAGIPAREFLERAAPGEDVAVLLSRAARAADEGEYPGELANVLMMGATADHVVAANHSMGLDTALPEAIKSLYARAVARGHGRDGWASLIEVIRKP